MARLKAVEAIKETAGKAPANVKFLFEGEEEIGSPNLGPFVKANMDALKADGYLWEGGGVDEQDRPVVSLGNKGLLYVELRAEGASTDVHSSMAPLVLNPAWRLIWALNTLKDRDERIRIAGWYDDVKPPTEGR
jgi:acetylornithine deacetylase/succinyl-diaminopimelate desuccinylase-like protein